MSDGTPRYTLDVTMKMNLKERGYVGVEWINLAQVWVQWQALASMVMRFGVAKKAGNLVSSKRLVSHVIPCPTKLVKNTIRCLQWIALRTSLFSRFFKAAVVE
jgi:hypothetical protein